LSLWQDRVSCLGYGREPIAEKSSLLLDGQEVKRKRQEAARTPLSPPSTHPQ
jgi:hypothetical protein